MKIKQIAKFSMLLTITIILSFFFATPTYAQEKDYDWDFNFEFNTISSFSNFEIYNGQQLKMTPNIKKSPAGGKLKKVMYYLDGRLLEENVNEPFALSHEMNGVSIGVHKLTVAVYCSTPKDNYLNPFNFYYSIEVLGSLYDNAIIDALEQAKKAWERKDYTKELYWYSKAAEGGAVLAMEQLSIMYTKGIGTNPNLDKALDWATKAAYNNSWGGLFQQGNIYQAKHDYSQALTCYKKAASRQFGKDERSFACFVVGRYYESGIGVNKDLIEARNWYKKGAEDGDANSADRLKLIDDHPSPVSNETAKLSWLSKTQANGQRQYSLKIGVNSTSKIEDVTIYQNGELSRGVTPINNDGYSFVIDKTLTLADGSNIVKVIVRNAAGISTIEKSVVFTSILPLDNSRRIALVMGNADYKGLNKLNNPVNDATDIANKLESLGFHVIRALNQNKQGMEEAIANFGSEAGNYDAALFYYAGHGICCDNINYLIPIDANIPDKTSAKYNCTDVNLVMDYLEKSQCKVKIVILDACRNNPFERSWSRGLQTEGLSMVDAPIGTLVAYSTSPGTTAEDGGEGQRNSPYTSALLEMLDKPNISLTDFFQNVLEIVATKTHERQYPWTSSSLRGNFYFNKKK